MNTMQQEVKMPDMQADDKKVITSSYRSLLKSFKKPLSDEDMRAVRSAYELALNAHHGQRRKSGEPYITHPIAVAKICVEEIGLGPTAVICALLHDVVEDTEVKLDEIRQKFGDKVRDIVDGLTKLDSLHEYENPQAENITRFLRAMITDVRVVLIKMADRLHNLRTIKSMKPEKQLKIAAETDSVYAPLAHRLGLHQVKTEFQDTCLKIMHPAEYQDIKAKLAEKKQAREAYIERFIAPIKEKLEKEYDINARITGRPKSIYSIYKKMHVKNVAFKDIFDLFAIRIIINVDIPLEKPTCWQVYSAVTDAYKPIPERLKDWITNPKANGYESLHTTVVGPEGRFVEIQIRSERMDEIAERGFAAHWKYKGVKELKSKADVFANWLDQVRDTLEMHASGNAVEMLAAIQSNLYADEVHVLTPKGDMVVLPEGATALDFAFEIHSDVGCTCQAVKVNHALVPFDYKLKNGDQIEVITRKNQKPSEDWLSFVVTAKARNRIRAALQEEKRRHAAYGRDILERKLHNGFKVGVEENADMLAKVFGYPNRLEFLCAIAFEQFDFSQLKRFRADGLRLVEIEQPKPAPAPEDAPPPSETPQTPRSKQAQRAEVIINGEPGTYYSYKFATCCNPVQGDNIFAFVGSPREGAKIHRYTCPNAAYLLTNMAHKVLQATWGNLVKSEFVTNIVVTGVDTGPGIINQLSNVISNMGINIRSFSIAGDNGYFLGKFSLVVANTDQLNFAMMELKKFDYVNSVQRADA